MWMAEFKFDGSKAPAGAVAKACNISLSAYPISFSETTDSLLIYFACNIYGSETDKNKFIKNAKQHSSVLFLEQNNAFMILLIKEPKNTKPIYHHNIIHTKPIFISNEGYETWSIASQNKSEIIEFYTLLKKLRNAKLIFIKNKKIENISIAQLQPNLTDKQKNAINLAIREGYYDTPRRIDVKKLAKLSKLAFSTYQTHLRKAESKLIPYSYLKVNSA